MKTNLEQVNDPRKAKDISNSKQPLRDECRVVLWPVSPGHLTLAVPPGLYLVGYHLKKIDNIVKRVFFAVAFSPRGFAIFSNRRVLFSANNN